MEELECSEVKMLVAAHDGDGPEFWRSAEHRRHLDDLDVLWSGNRRILRVKTAGPVEAVGSSWSMPIVFVRLAPSDVGKRLTQNLEGVSGGGENSQDLVGKHLRYEFEIVVIRPDWRRFPSRYFSVHLDERLARSPLATGWI
jgi:hypothetical protein